LLEEGGKRIFICVKLTCLQTIAMRRVILCFLFGQLLLTAPGVAQRNTKDSLTSLLRTPLKSMDRVDVLNQLAYQYYDDNDSLALNYAHQALRLAQQINHAKGIKYAFIMVGLGYSSKAEFKSAIHYFRLSGAVVANGASGAAAYGLVLLGNCYREMANYDSAIFFYRKAKSSANGDDWSMANVYKNMALVDILLWKNNEAIILLDSADGCIQKSKGNNQFVRVDLLTLYGQAYKNILKYDLSNEYYERMCAASYKLDDYYHLVMCKLNYADLAYQQGNYPTALKSGFEALELTKKYVYPPQYVKVLIAVGEVYEELSQYDVAAEYFFKALAIAERLGLQAEIALSYSQLAWIKKDQRQFSTAIDYANKSLRIRASMGDKKGVANCHNVLGLIYLLQKDYPQSIHEHELALKLRQQIDYKLGISASIFNFSLTYEAINHVGKAFDDHLEALEMEEKIQNKQSLAISYNSIAELLIRVGKLKEAYGYANKANLLGSETGSTLLKRNNASIFVAYYQALGDFKMAFEYQGLYQALNDSVYSETSALRLAEVEAIYNVEKKENDIELLSQKQVAQARQLQLQQVELSRKNLIIAYASTGILIFVISGIVGIRYYREKTEANKSLRKLNREISEQKEEIQAQSEELVEASSAIANINKELEGKIENRTSELKQAYKELDTFFYRASHDFRRPITTFMGLAGVAKITVKDQASLELFEKVSETAASLDKMLYKLQSISDVGSQQMVFKEVFLKELIEEVLHGFTKMMQQKRVAVSLEINEQTPLVSYPAMVKIIIENLIENAIHFAGFERPFVVIRASVHEEAAVIEVEDNGQGIMEEYKPRIFEMYFRANEHSKGNGLGLYIAKKAIEKLSGHIFFRSKHGAGSSFTVELPNHSNKKSDVVTHRLSIS